MSGYIGLAVGFIGALLQATVLPDYRWAGVQPDLVVVAVVGWAALRRVGDGLIWALFGGLALDMFSSTPFGASILACVLAALAAGAVARRLRGLHPFLVVLAAPAGVLAYYLASLPLVLAGPGDLRDFATGVLLPALALDTALAPLVLGLLALLAQSLARPGYVVPGRAAD